jgi:hypothetical protein
LGAIGSAIGLLGGHAADVLEQRHRQFPQLDVVLLAGPAQHVPCLVGVAADESHQRALGLFDGTARLQGAEQILECGRVLGCGGDQRGRHQLFVGDQCGHVDGRRRLGQRAGQHHRGVLAPQAGHRDSTVNVLQVRPNPWCAVGDRVEGQLGVALVGSQVEVEHRHLVGERVRDRAAESGQLRINELGLDAHCRDHCRTITESLVLHGNCDTKRASQVGPRPVQHTVQQRDQLRVLTRLKVGRGHDVPINR